MRMAIRSECIVVLLGLGVCSIEGFAPSNAITNVNKGRGASALQMAMEGKEKKEQSRRSVLSKGAGAALGGLLGVSSGWSNIDSVANASGIAPPIAPAIAPAIASPAMSADVTWPLGKVAFSLLPLAGTSSRRATVEEEVVKGTIWTHDQIQGVVNVNVPVRQTVVKLSEAAGGGLLVHNPVAPTPQLMAMMDALVQKHGPVRHIVLGTVALEHKATFGPFAQRYPDATVWLQPGQWAFPVDLPIELSGVTQRGPKLQQLAPPSTSPEKGYRYYASANPTPEWAADIDYEILGPLRFQSVGAFSETAFFHKPTKTLLVTDTVVSVTNTPPAIIQEDPRAMLFHARDSIDEIVRDDAPTREKGWRRMVQFGLVFFPSQIDVVPVAQWLPQASKVEKSMRPLGKDAVPYSLYPWTWHDNDADLTNFNAISQQGALFCPPILTKLILDREPVATLAWVDRVCQRFDFERVIPCHLNNNVKATPAQFYKAFDPLRSDPINGQLYTQRPLAEDLALLQKASDLLTDVGVVKSAEVCDLEPARLVGRFAKKQS